MLAEFADDRVTATVEGGEPESWREWEVELVNGDHAFLEAAGELLRSAGAQPAVGPSKLARALGDRVPPPESLELPKKPRTSAAVPRVRRCPGAGDPRTRPRGTAGCPGLDPQVPGGDTATAVGTGDVPAGRGSCGRDLIRVELKWLAGELGAARDAEVQREHFAAEVAEQPAELVMGRVAGRIDDHLRGGLQGGRAGALAALESERYFRLLDMLDELIAKPPLTDDDRKAAKQLPELVDHDRRRLRKAVRRAEAAETSAEQDHELHEVRKAAKRLRYAAESAVPVLGDDAASLAARAEEVQEVLGEHQDSVVSRDLLRQLAVEVYLDGGNSFTFGRLHAAEELRGTRSRDAFLALWPTLEAR